MKSKILLLAFLIVGLGTNIINGQTTVYAKNSDISDNLDLRAVASLFGDSNDLQDFEYKLNDPKFSISNLDLNNDGQVDYLRVIESVENRTHLIIIQAVLDRDVYQDIATIDVEQETSDRVAVQVVGNSYLYGNNYIYEPIFHTRPRIFASFFVSTYRPYYSSWSWGIFPSFFVAWRPMPIYRYRSHVNIYINNNNRYNYVEVRRSQRAPQIYATRRSNGFEQMRPNYSFSQRNANVNNRYELDQRHRTVSNRTRTTTNNAINVNRNSSMTRPNVDRGANVNSRNQSSQTERGNRDIIRNDRYNSGSQNSNSQDSKLIGNRPTNSPDRSATRQTTTNNSKANRSGASVSMPQRNVEQRRSSSNQSVSGNNSRIQRSPSANSSSQARSSQSSRSARSENSGERGGRR